MALVSKPPSVARISKQVKGAGKQLATVDDPIVHATKAFFRPFDALKGLAAPFSDGRPSQKFMAKAQGQITLTSGQIMAFMINPNLAANGDYASMVFAIGASTGGAFTTNGTWKSATVGDLTGAFGTINKISTTTPYRANVLSTGYEFACVGNGVKFTYEGAELYRGGTMRYIFDKEGLYNQAFDWTVDTPNGLIDFVNSSANAVRQSINKENVVEINASPIAYGYQPINAVIETAYGSHWTGCSLLGGATATTYFGVKPNVVGYYVNTSGNTISFHVDIVEHWAVSAFDIQSLQTPSYASATMDTHTKAVMDNVRQVHASMPNTHHATVASTVLKAMKSPLGHELLNAGIRAALA